MADNVLLSVDEMYAADAAAVEQGVYSIDLMEAAGRAVVREIRTRWEKRPVAVLAGPGNNGGDGFVAARLLADAGWPVRLGLLGSVDRLSGDAAVNAGRWQGEVAALNVDLLEKKPLVVDAMFGAGLTRPLDGAPLTVAEAINGQHLDCVAVDIPSGVHGDSGAVMGAAPRAQVTVTFFRPKPGHYLLPGRDLTGDVVIADIGIPDAVLDAIRPKTFINGPMLWLDRFPWPDAADHKYSRGHGVVLGGAEMTGAARLAAMGRQTLRGRAGPLSLHRRRRSTFMPRRSRGRWSRPSMTSRLSRTCFPIDARTRFSSGPGAGVTETTRTMALAALGAGKAVVIDADGLTVFENDPGSLFAAIDGPCVLTPHDGEFKRLFSIGGDKPTRTRRAAGAARRDRIVEGR